jgi:hypothetical protein
LDSTVSLPADLKAALAREAEHRGVAEAELSERVDESPRRLGDT